MRPLSRLAASSLLLVSGLLRALPARAQQVLRAPSQSTPDFLGWVPDEFIVVLRAEARGNLLVERKADGRPRLNSTSLQQLIDAHGVLRFVRQFPSARAPGAGSRRPDLTGYYAVQLSPGASLDAALAAFAADPSVEHAERIGMHSLHAEPNDPYFRDSPNPQQFNFDQWHYWNTHSIHADQAWDTVTGDATVVVAVLDAGIRYFHLDLGGNSPVWGPGNPFTGGNIWMHAGESPGNSVDDDGNGFVDDTIGWDFVSTTGGPGVTCLDTDCGGVDNDPDDTVGHGTHVAGTVGAITNNNRIVAGVAGGWSNGLSTGAGNGVKILPLRIGYYARVGPDATGIVRMDWAAQAMSYVADLVDAGVNVTAVNCSWGSSNSGGLGAAVDAVLAQDVMVIHSAGNNNTNVADYLGGRVDVMNVAATDMNGNGASFTSYGTWVDVAAPGVTILSTYRNPSDPNPANHYLAISDGTSMAAPHVAGIAALLESCNPALTGPQKFSLITGNTSPYTDVRYLGTGIANAAAAVAAANCGACDLVAAFSGAPLTGCATLAVAFTDLSTGTGINAWSWSFGDGGTSTQQNPVHPYQNAGTYTVRLIVSSASCADTLEVPHLIGVLPAPPQAAFTGTPTTGVLPLLVSFTDQSTAAPTSWSWDFGDGNGSTEQNPSHTYQTPGTYSVTLIAANACAADTLVRPSYVVVVDPNIAVAPFELGGATGAWAWPNPVVPSTKVFFRLERQARIEIIIYDVAGRPVRHLLSRSYAPGTYGVAFDGRDDRGTRLPSGLYVYRFAAGEHVDTGKLLLSR